MTENDAGISFEEHGIKQHKSSTTRNSGKLTLVVDQGELSMRYDRSLPRPMELSGVVAKPYLIPGVCFSTRKS